MSDRVPPDESLRKEFEELFRQCERELFSYIYGLTPSHADASDILQETAVRLWQHFDRFDRSRPFGAWARKYAHTQVLKAREQGKYRRWMGNAFDESTVAQIAWEYELHGCVLESRKTALEDCLKKLEPSSIDLLRQRYWSQENLRKMSKTQQIPEHKLYRRLSNLRRMLQECIDSRLAAQP